MSSDSIFVIYSDEVVYNTVYSREDAEACVEELLYQARSESMDELGMDEDASEEDIMEVDFYASLEGSAYHIVEVSEEECRNQSCISVDIDGEETELRCSDILRHLDSAFYDDFDDDDDDF